MTATSYDEKHTQTPFQAFLDAPSATTSKSHRTEQKALHGSTRARRRACLGYGFLVQHADDHRVPVVGAAQAWPHTREGKSHPWATSGANKSPATCGPQFCRVRAQERQCVRVAVRHCVPCNGWCDAFNNATSTLLRMAKTTCFCLGGVTLDCRTARALSPAFWGQLNRTQASLLATPRPSGCAQLQAHTTATPDLKMPPPEPQHLSQGQRMNTRRLPLAALVGRHRKHIKHQHRSLPSSPGEAAIHTSYIMQQGKGVYCKIKWRTTPPRPQMK